jgi:hypothetical protein
MEGVGIIVCPTPSFPITTTTRKAYPFKILEKRGEVVYQLELPPQLSDMHDVFHVS